MTRYRHGQICLHNKIIKILFYAIFFIKNVLLNRLKFVIG